MTTPPGKGDRSASVPRATTAAPAGRGPVRRRIPAERPAPARRPAAAIVVFAAKP